jgi:PAS domain S-box-containing protein
LSAHISKATDAQKAALLEREKQLSEEAQALAKLNECSLRLWQTNRLKEGLREMLRAVIELLGADKGNVQILDPERNVLTIAVQQGFEQDFLDHFREVSAIDDSACGRALRKYERVIIEDIEHDAGFAPHRQIARAAGFRAVVSTPLIRRDGKVLGLLSTHFGSVHRPTDQELRRLELYVRQAADFFERRQREEELRLSEERYRKLTQTLDAEVRVRTADLEKKTAELLQKAALLDLANDAIFVKSANGTISYWNEGATRLYGWTITEALGHSPVELLHSEYPIPLAEIESKEDWRGEICHTKRGGSRIIVVSRWTKIRDSNGGLVGWLEINTDITERKRSEEGLRVLSGKLLHMQDEERRKIARELHDSAGQTLAAVLMNMSQLIDANGRDPEQARLLADNEAMLQNLNKELRTISHLLHPPLLDEMGLSSALQGFVEGFAQRSGIATTLEIDPDFGRLDADAEITIFRVVQECLTNVHRHSGSRKAVVRLTRSSSEVRLEVQDQGKGIPANMRVSITEAAVGAVGVGLRGMRERVRQLEGNLEVQSGLGTTITAKLPVPKPAVLSVQEVA